MRDKNERTRANYEGTPNGNGRTGQQGKRVGAEPATNGQVRSGSAEVHSEIRQISLFSAIDVREPIREDIGTGGTSPNKIEDNNSSTRRLGESGGYRGLLGESSSAATDQAGSRQLGNEGNSVKADVKNYKQ